MTEENKFKEVDSIQLYNDYIGYVKLYDASHANESEAQRVWTVTTIASLAYGNEEAKNPEALYKRMQAIHHESLWEFVRDGYGSRGINSSMRAQPHQYEGNYSHHANIHQENIACFRIKIPIFVARQFMRHRSKSYLEISRRYTKDSKVPFEWFCDYDSDEANALVDAHHKAAYDLYKTLIGMGVETQKASRIIGQDVYTEFYAMGSSEDLRNFFNLRLDSHAQAQIRAVAEAMLELLVQHQPELAKKVIV
jgi:thymidylate synthase (FAD)